MTGAYAAWIAIGVGAATALAALLRRRLRESTRRKTKDPNACERCGRPRSAATTMHYHSRERFYTYSRCACGYEWTVATTGFNPEDPVGSDEILEVHEILRRSQASLKDLLKP